ncbi:MAG: hypothetical protein P9M03_06345 [Candidatus Theseobacter exili]|nr:hypothetical protein [Candidatus Theseobacter exili]
MTDHLHNSLIKKGQGRKREDIIQEFRSRHDKDANVVALVENQCDWLKEIGFADVDCFFKIFEIAIFAGRKA